MTIMPPPQKDEQETGVPTIKVNGICSDKNVDDAILIEILTPLGENPLKTGNQVESQRINESTKTGSMGKSLDSINSIAVSGTDDSNKLENSADREKWYTIAWQVFIPFTIAGFGTIGAGLVLGYVENYEVFKNVKSLYILVPAIIGLKGNLDMCLASRLCTQAHLGNMSTIRETAKMIIGNIALVQIQAIVAASLVSIFAVSVSALLNGDFQLQHSILLATCSILTATISCFFLDLILTAIVIITFKSKLNPDNLASPFAASIGDVVSLGVLSSWAKLLYTHMNAYPFVMPVILSCFLFIVLPTWLLIVRKNIYTKEVLKTGWIPVLGALIISGLGGLVLDSAVGKFTGFVVFQPIINGIGGNLVSVQASRISTMLHKTSLRGVIPPHTKQWIWPWTALIKGVLPARSARVLLVLSLPGQTLFVLLADIFYNNGQSRVTLPFVATYVFVSFIQIIILLYVCHLLIHFLWKRKIDPDNSAIPYLTALGDVLGSSLLLLAFLFLQYIHQDYQPISE